MEKTGERRSWWTMALLLAASLVIYLTGVTPALAQAAYGSPGAGPGGGWCGSFPWMAGMGGFGFFFNIILLVLVIGGVVALLRWTVNNAGKGSGLSGPSGQSGQASGRALDIIKERYARGEIDREEYQRLKEDLL